MIDRLRGIALFFTEAGGVAGLAAGAWWRIDPLAGVVIFASYVILVANSARRGW